MAAKAKTSVHVCGPLLANGFDPSSVAQPQFVSSLYIRGTQFGRKDPMHWARLTQETWVSCKTIYVQFFDLSSSLAASEARNLVAFFAALRRIHDSTAPPADEFVPVILLSAKAKICSKMEKPERARPTLEAAGISVYRLTA